MGNTHSVQRLQEVLKELQEELENANYLNNQSLLLAKSLRESLQIVVSDENSAKLTEEYGNTITDVSFMLSARRVLTSSIIIFLSLSTPDRLRISRSEPDNLYINLNNCFISILNAMDFQSPSWKIVRSDHLNAGFEVVAAQRFVLRGYAGFNQELPQDIFDFPQLV